MIRTKIATDPIKSGLILSLSAAIVPAYAASTIASDAAATRLSLTGHHSCRAT
jgi:hypothetical protein